MTSSESSPTARMTRRRAASRSVRLAIASSGIRGSVKQADELVFERPSVRLDRRYARAGADECGDRVGDLPGRHAAEDKGRGSFFFYRLTERLQRLEESW